MQAKNFSDYYADFNEILISKTAACAQAGKTGGAIRFALIFLVLFASRQNEHKEKVI